MCRFSKLLLFSFFFCKDGSDWLMKRASYSCCNFLCVVLAATFLKYRRCRLSRLPFVWHLFFIVTHTHTHTHAHAHTHTHTHTHTYTHTHLRGSGKREKRKISSEGEVQEADPNSKRKLAHHRREVERNEKTTAPRCHDHQSSLCKKIFFYLHTQTQKQTDNIRLVDRQ